MIKEIYNNLSIYGSLVGESEMISCQLLLSECSNLINYDPLSNSDIYYKIKHSSVFFISLNNNLIGCNSDYISTYEKMNREFSTSPYNEFGRYTLSSFKDDKDFHFILNHINEIMYQIKLQSTPDVSSEKRQTVDNLVAIYNLFLLN